MATHTPMHNFDLTKLPLTVNDLKIILDEAQDLNVNAAYFFQRKEYLSYDDVAGSRNTSYGSSLDDIAVTIQFEIPQWTNSWHTISGVGKELKKNEILSEKATLIEKLEKLDQALAEIEVS